ncbi:MAG TPA: hypothetical protein ENJ82_16150 [Bacteroidetes bacterium]|nr:hypothetical protein [Bacteroidota bacterium]
MLFSKILKWGLAGLLAVLFFIILINLWVVWSAAGLIYAKAEAVPATDVAILLGTSRLVGGRPNVFFFTRIEAAAALYKQGKVKKIIVSGDNRTSHYNETDDMRRELVKAGVPEQAIVNDHAGFRTLDSMVRAKLVFGQTKVIVVSQKFHVQRAIYIARAHGIEAIGYIAKDPVHAAPFYRVMLREYFARVKAFLDCYILQTAPQFPGPPEPITFL